MVSVSAWMWFFLGHYGLLKSCPITQVIRVPPRWCVHMQKKYKTETSCHVLEILSKIICTVIFKSDFLNPWLETYASSWFLDSLQFSLSLFLLTVGTRHVSLSHTYTHSHKELNYSEASIKHWLPDCVCPNLKKMLPAIKPYFSFLSVTGSLSLSLPPSNTLIEKRRCADGLFIFSQVAV